MQADYFHTDVLLNKLQLVANICMYTCCGLILPSIKFIKSSSDTVKIVSAFPRAGPWYNSPEPFFKSMAGGGKRYQKGTLREGRNVNLII